MGTVAPDRPPRPHPARRHSRLWSFGGVTLAVAGGTVVVAAADWPSGLTLTAILGGGMMIWGAYLQIQRQRAENRRAQEAADAEAKRQRAIADADVEIAIRAKRDAADRESLTAQVQKVTEQLAEALADNKQIRGSLHALRDESHAERVRHAADMADRDDRIKGLEAEVARLRADLKAAQDEARKAADALTGAVRETGRKVDQLRADQAQPNGGA